MNLEVGLYYGSTNGDTAHASALFALLCEQGALPWSIERFDVASYFLEDMPTFDFVVLGVPTWNTGQMQKDWEAVFDEFDSLDLTGIPVALFGLGDQAGYPQTFADALAYFAEKVQERGARLVGRWDPARDPAGYRFGASWALEGGLFVGLVLDQVNQPEVTEVRLRQWIDQLARELAADGDGR